MLDLFNNQVVSVDINRDQGFLTGMGINPGSTTRTAKEAKTGKYSGGDYTDRLPPADPGRDRRRAHGDGDLPVGQPGHQRRLRDQRAGRRGRLQRAEGAEQAERRHDPGDRRLLRTGSGSSTRASSRPTPRSTRARWPSLGVAAIAKLANGGSKPTVDQRQGLLRHRHEPGDQDAGLRRREPGCRRPPRRRAGAVADHACRRAGGTGRPAADRNFRRPASIERWSSSE